MGAVLEPGAMAELHLVEREGVLGVRKRIRPDQATNPAFRALLTTEAEVGRRLHHEAVIRVLDDGDGWLVLERADHSAEDLPPTDAPELQRLLERVLDALHAAHRTGIVHRDVKASNVLHTPRGWVLGDWGGARVDGIPDPAPALGSPEAMSPSRLAGGPATPASDRYAVGVLGWQLATGTLPFPGRRWAATLAAHLRGLPPFEPQFEVSPAFEAVIRGLLDPLA